MIRRILQWIIEDELRQAVASVVRQIESRDEMLASLHGEVLSLRQDVDRLSRTLAELLVGPYRRRSRDVDRAIEEFFRSDTE